MTCRILRSIAVVALCLIVSQNVFSQDIVNLVQWPSADGGNDHWYAVVAKTMPWSHHDSLASTYTQDDLPGYLATITSAEENQFIVDNVIVGLTPDNIADEFYLGGSSLSGAWAWGTGEPFEYVNWDEFEPSGDGPALAMWGDSYPSKVGKWNDVPAFGPVGSIHQLWAVIEWGEPAAPEPPTIVNLVQWPISQGGNDHWYAVVAETMPWNFHNDLAPQLDQNGMSGYLATVTSAEENQFIVDNVIIGLEPDNIADEFYLGGSNLTTTWRWVTDESFDYTNWDEFEPSGDGPALAIWGDSYPTKVGKWNDVPAYGPVGSIHQLWAVIEWGEYEVSDSTTILNLVQWPSSEGGNDHWYAVIAETMPWDQHRDLAPQLEQDGRPGYLATIGSEAENQFIVDNVIVGLEPNNIADEFYLGGSALSGSWAWETGELFYYTNWTPGEPSGDGPALAMWGDSYGSRTGQWNDVPAFGPITSIHQLWSVVEWGELSDQELLAVDVDVMPRSCPNVFELVDREVEHGVGHFKMTHGPDMQVAILGTADFDVSQIDLTSIRMEEMTPLRSRYRDVTAPLEIVVDECECADLDPDGFNDLLMRFDNDRIAETLGDVSEGQVIPLSIFGELEDGTPFHGSDCVAITFKTPPGQSPVVNLTQWKAAQGGNDHWYAVIAKTMPWNQHDSLTSTYVQEGMFGYLATITSPEENAFIVDNVIAKLNPDNIADEFYLGGSALSGNWAWGTGESFDYTYWNSGEPSGDGPALAIWGDSYPTISGTWNDVPAFGPVGSIHQLWAVIEWGELEAFAGSTGNSADNCCRGTRGNVNGDPSDMVNIADATYLISFLFGIPSGPAPVCSDEANVNGDPEGKINISDITHLTTFLFGDADLISLPPCTR